MASHPTHLVFSASMVLLDGPACLFNNKPSAVTSFQTPLSLLSRCLNALPFVIAVTDSKGKKRTARGKNHPFGWFPGVKDETPKTSIGVNGVKKLRFNEKLSLQVSTRLAAVVRLPRR